MKNPITPNKFEDWKSSTALWFQMAFIFNSKCLVSFQPRSDKDLRSSVPAKCRVRIAQQHHEVHQYRRRTRAEASHGKDSTRQRRLLILAAGIAMRMIRIRWSRLLQPVIANAGPELRNWHSSQTLLMACLVLQVVLFLSPTKGIS